MSHLYAASTLLLLSLPKGFAVPFAQDGSDAGLPPFQLLNATAALAPAPALVTGEVSVQTDPIVLSEPIITDLPELPPPPTDVSNLTGGVLVDEPQVISVDDGVDDDALPSPGTVENEFAGPPLPLPQPIPIENGIGDGTGPEAFGNPSTDASLPIDWESLIPPDDSFVDPIFPSQPAIPTETALTESVPLSLPIPLPEPTETALTEPIPLPVPIPLPEPTETALTEPVPLSLPIPLPEPTETTLAEPAPLDVPIPLPEPTEMVLTELIPLTVPIPLPESTETALTEPAPLDVPIPLPEPTETAVTEPVPLFWPIPLPEPTDILSILPADWEAGIPTDDVFVDPILPVEPVVPTVPILSEPIPVNIPTFFPEPIVAPPPIPEAPEPTPPDAESALDIASFNSIVQELANVISSFFTVMPPGMTANETAPLPLANDASPLRRQALPQLVSNPLSQVTDNLPAKVPVNGLTTLYKPLLQILSTVLNSAPRASSGTSKLPTSNGLGSSGISSDFSVSIGIGKRELEDIDPTVALSIVKQILSVLNSILGNVPAIENAVKAVPLENVPSTTNLGRLRKRSVLTQEQSNLLAIATAKNVELKQAISELKLHLSHLSKRQVDTGALIDLLSSLVSIIDTVLDIIQKAPAVGDNASELPVDPSTLTEKLQLDRPPMDPASLLGSLPPDTAILRGSVPADDVLRPRGGPLRARQVLGGLGGLGGVGVLPGLGVAGRPGPLPGPLPGLGPGIEGPGGGLAALENIAKPVTDITKPVLEVTQPVAAPVAPILGVATPALDVVQPGLDVVQPALDVVQPALDVLKPALEITNPITAVPGPVVGFTKPGLDLAEPVGGATEPLTQVVAPVVDATKPVVEAAAPVLDTAKPATDAVKFDVPFDAIQGLVQLISSLLNHGNLNLPVVKRAESVSAFPLLHDLRGSQDLGSSSHDTVPNNAAHVVKPLASRPNVAAGESISGTTHDMPVIEATAREGAIKNLNRLIGLIASYESVRARSGVADTSSDSTGGSDDRPQLPFDAGLASLSRQLGHPEDCCSLATTFIELLSSLTPTPQATLHKRQNGPDVTPDMVRSFIWKWHTIGVSLSAIDPAMVQDLMQIVLDPSLVPSYLPVLDKYPEAVREFVLELFYLLQLLQDSGVPDQDKFDILEIMFDADFLEASTSTSSNMKSKRDYDYPTWTEESLREFIKSVWQYDEALASLGAAQNDFNEPFTSANDRFDEYNNPYPFGDVDNAKHALAKAYLFNEFLKSLPPDDQRSLLEALYQGLGARRKFKVKRSMRYGRRHPQQLAEDGLPDEGVRLDDAQKLGPVAFYELLGPEGSLDPLGLRDPEGSAAFNGENATELKSWELEEETCK